MTARATVTLDHKSGPVLITIEAATPEVAAHLANSLRGHFQGKCKGSNYDSIADILKMVR